MALKEYLQQQYQGRESFLTNVVFPMFGEDLFEDGYNESVLGIKPELIPLAQSSGIESILRIGTINVDFNPIDIYDITVSDKVQMQRNRVSIQMLVRRIMDTYSSSFMIFHYKDNSSWDWRFTFCSKKGNNDESTDSKRYTFLLGPNQSCRTAAENFEKLIKIENKESITVESIISAFDVEALSREFFGKYKEHYSKFVSYMCDEASGMRNNFIDCNFDKTGLDAAKIKDKEEKPIRDYVKRLLGRIVFLHFLQKKGWMGVPAGKEWGDGDKDFMRSLYENASESQRANFLDEILEPLFSDALNADRTSNGDLFDTKVNLSCGSTVRIPYLNGGLFERDKYDEPKTVFPSSYFKDLLEFFYQYNFTIDENDPNDAQVGVDPEMLGRIFENLLEDNKDKGAFYTPKEIVQYMCRQALVAYLQTDEDDTVKSQIEIFVATYDVSEIGGAESDLARTIDSKLKEVKICDPAIGSGAFPMGLLKELFLCRGAIENFDNASEIKKHIIQNNIYGVDIEKGAVDIARLRFWLSLIVDEDTPNALPNLDYKIMQGNSLLESYKGVDLSHILDEQDGILNFAASIRDDLNSKIISYYSCPKHEEKKILQDEINVLVHQQLHETGEIDADFDYIDVSGNDQFFLWHTWFSDVFNRPSDCDKSGFDIVIGNPPYISHDNIPSSIPCKYFECFEAFADIYCYFYEIGLKALSAKGVLCFITSNSFLRANYGLPLRRYIHEHFDILQLIDIEGTQIFGAAIVNTVIAMFTKSRTDRQALVVNEHWGVTTLKDFIKSNRFSYEQSDFAMQPWTLVAPHKLYLRRRIEMSGETLEKLGTKIRLGLATGDNNAFIIDERKRKMLIEKDCKSADLIKPVIRGQDIMRFTHIAPQYILLTKNDVDVRRDYPAIYEYLDSFGDKFKKRGAKGKHWTNLRACAFFDDFKREKIIWIELTDNGRFSYSNTEEYLLNSAYFLIPPSNVEAKYLLGLLNSSVIRFYIRQIAATSGMGTLRWINNYVKQIPIPIADSAIQSKIVALVEAVLRIKAEDRSADTSRLEYDIDCLVYDIFRLTKDDIKIVEGN